MRDTTQQCPILFCSGDYLLILLFVQLGSLLELGYVSYIKGGGTAQLFEKVDGVQYPGELSGVLPGILDKGGGGFIQQSGKTLPVQLFQGNTVLQDLPLRAA